MVLSDGDDDPIGRVAARVAFVFHRERTGRCKVALQR